jgi:hypothetical protein
VSSKNRLLLILARSWPAAFRARRTTRRSRCWNRVGRPSARAGRAGRPRHGALEVISAAGGRSASAGSGSCEMCYGIGRYAFQKGLKMFQHPRYGGGLEQIGVVNQPRRKIIVFF